MTAAFVLAGMLALAVAGRVLVLRHRRRLEARARNRRAHLEAFVETMPTRARERKHELREFLAQTRTAAMTEARGYDARDAEERRRARNKRKAGR